MKYFKLFMMLSILSSCCLSAGRCRDLTDQEMDESAERAEKEYREGLERLEISMSKFRTKTIQNCSDDGETQ